MSKYLVQVTPEGGPNGTKIVEADDVSLVQGGGLAFYRLGKLCLVFRAFEVFGSLECIAETEALTTEFNASEPTEG